MVLILNKKRIIFELIFIILNNLSENIRKKDRQQRNDDIRRKYGLFCDSNFLFRYHYTFIFYPIVYVIKDKFETSLIYFIFNISLILSINNKCSYLTKLKFVKKTMSFSSIIPIITVKSNIYINKQKNIF